MYSAYSPILNCCGCNRCKKHSYNAASVCYQSNL